MKASDIFESDDLALMPLTDSQKEIFCSITRDGLPSNFKPIVKLSVDDVAFKMVIEVQKNYSKLSKNDLEILKAYISVLIMKKYSVGNILYDFSELDQLYSKLSSDSLNVINNVIDESCKKIADECLIDIKDFCDIENYNKTYDLCVECRDYLSNELDRLDNEYSFSYSDDVKDENEDARARYYLLLNDLDYLEEIIGKGKILNDEVIAEFYNIEKSKNPLRKYMSVSSVYAMITKKLFSGDFSDSSFIRDVYKELTRSKYWKSTSHKFRKEFDKFIKESLKQNI